MTYSLDFRKQVFKVKRKEKLSFTELGERFGIGRDTVFRWSKKLEPEKHRNKAATKINMVELKTDVENYPDAYTYERAQRLGVSKSGVWQALQRLGVSYKKNPAASAGQSRKASWFLPETQ